MRTIFLAMAAILVSAKEYRDPSGFSVQILDGWQVTKFDRGMVKIANPGGTQFAYVIPILGRTMDCGTLLRKNLEGNWPAFPGAAEIQIAASGRNGAVARFTFQKGTGRGAVLCAETGPRTGMLYALGAPANLYVVAQPVLAASLKSFRYGAPQAGAPPAGTNGEAAALPPMTKWQEPNEGAFVIPIPQGWQAQGGITRLSNTDIRGGIRIWSPDGARMIQFNDIRLDKVLVPGRQQMPNAPMGRGWRMGPYQTGVQMAEWYLRQVWANDLGLSGIEIVGRNNLQQMSAEADRLPAQMGVRGVQHAYGEVVFRAMRKGQAVEGRLLGMTRMMWSPNLDLAGGSFDTEIKGHVGPTGSSGQLARIGGYMEGHTEHNYQWIAANRQAASADVQMTMRHLHASAERQQRDFWERMDASDRRRESVNDVLGGRVRLSDGQGNQYEAKAGSNYYFYDEQSKRRDGVVGMDVYPSTTVDLRPLEVIR